MSQAIISGNIGSIDEMRETRTGQKVVNFSVAETKRVLDKETNEWSDGDTIWYNLTAWNRLAENLVATDDSGSPLISGGTHVVILAHYVLKQGFTTKSGEEVGPRPQLVADDIGVSMRAFPATSPRLKGGGGNSAAAKPKPRQAAATPKQAPVNDADQDFDDLFGDDDFLG